MTANSAYRLNKTNFTKALVIFRLIAGNNFCQSIILTSENVLLEIQTFLDCYSSKDYFNIRSNYYNINELDNLIQSFGSEVSIKEIAPFEGILVEVGEFYGASNNLIEISQIQILSSCGISLRLRPDPDRMVADQMYLVQL